MSPRRSLCQASQLTLLQAAFKLYRQALDLVEGIMCAARCHESGSGTEVDLRKAKAMYQRVGMQSKSQLPTRS